MDFSPPTQLSELSFGSMGFSLAHIVWAGFVVGLLVYVVMALIYHHHWSYYGISIPQKTLAVLLFNGGALILLATVALLASALGTM